MVTDLQNVGSQAGSRAREQIRLFLALGVADQEQRARTVRDANHERVVVRVAIRGRPWARREHFDRHAIESAAELARTAEVPGAHDRDAASAHRFEESGVASSQLFALALPGVPQGAESHAVEARHEAAEMVGVGMAERVNSGDPGVPQDPS